MIVDLRRFLDAEQPYWLELDEVLNDIEKRLLVLSQVAKAGYVVSNFTPTRTLDVATATLPDLLNFVATLAQDFKDAGRLG